MRISYLLFVLLCCATAIQSQVSAEAISLEDNAFNTSYANRRVPTITGKLLNIAAEELKSLSISYTLVTPFLESQVRKTLNPQPDGSFSIQLDYAFPYQQIWFSVGDFFYAGLYANTDLYLELDMTKIKAVKEASFNGDGVNYMGTDGPLNTYLNNFVLFKRAEQLQLSSKINALIYSRALADSILPDYDKQFDSLKKIEEMYIAENPSPYGWILENERLSAYYGNLCSKYFGKIIADSLWQKMSLHKSYLVSNSSTEFYNYMAMYIERMPVAMTKTDWKDVAALQHLNHAEKLLIDSLKASETLKPSYPYSAEKIGQWSKQLQPRIQTIAMLRELDKNIERTDSMLPSAKADFLKLRMNGSKDINEQKLEMEHILRSMRTDWCIVVMKNEYKRTSGKIDEINKTLAMAVSGKQVTSFGKPLLETSFDATLYNASGMKATDFLAKLIQSNPGKAILIDLWATWCGPCLSEMPHSKILQQESKDLPVVFVYLCTLKSSTESKWKTKVAQLKQPGIHFLIDETLDAELAHYFSFTGYPGHALINTKGNYVPGAVTWMSEIANKEALALLLTK